MANDRKTIVRLLECMTGAREIRQYLDRFAAVDTWRFAVVKVGGKVLQDELDELASSLAFLQRVGLLPIVVHGAGPQLDVALAKRGIEKKTVDGLRYTDAAMLGELKRTFTAESMRLCDALEAAGATAVPITSGVFEAQAMDVEKYGHVGQITHLHLDVVRAAVNRGRIPVLASIAETESGQQLNVNADNATSALVAAVKPYKVVFLTGTGGILDGEGEIISSINLATDRDRLMKADYLDGGMRLKLSVLDQMLAGLPLQTSVSITRPGELARELFTHQGSGTLVRRGERVLHLTDAAAVDQPRLAGLIETAFGQTLLDAAALGEAEAVFVSEEYRAAAVVKRIDGRPYLDKFAVSPDARGEGLAHAVWDALMDVYPELIWRSRRSNPINTFYFERCDGCLKSDQWLFFWRGRCEPQQIAQLGHKVLAMPGAWQEKSA